MGIRSAFVDSIVRLFGWKVVVDCPIPNGGVIVGAPHTSMWDWACMMALIAKTGVKVRWLGKNSLFWFPLGPLLRAWGGVPVDRSSHNGLVDHMAQILKDNPGTFAALTPEGTRAGAEYWKSGFYRIAVSARVPIVLGFVDSATKTTGIGKILYPSADMRADMDIIRDFYRDKIGIKPGNTQPPRLREE
ncbi:hypothetical protein FYJ24_01915 [Actinomycetaceae bacterium WB03_NA08]|uniref:Phospholipid/glycerol acyltransferase domain-containing protein n=1 Tax=Scrofimicrobium canadense TaxID=2652290 RepID=A0A6N7W5X1_9ACTO|nr:hypothetical protein [Scrofimicrobium canadense]